MRRDREALRHFQRSPKAIRRTGRRPVGGANDDVAGERIFAPEKIERLVEPLVRDAPRDECAGREIRRHQRLSDAADRSRCEHRAQPLEHGVQRKVGETRDLLERIDEKSRDAILGDGEDACVDRIADLGRRGERG